MQTVQKTLNLFRQKITHFLAPNDQLNNKKSKKIDFDNEALKQPTIEEVMKSILIILKRNQSLLKQLQCLPQNEQLLEPFDYIFSNGGKRIRLVIAILINGLFNKENIPQEVIKIGGMIEMLHTGSLIIDDIEDQSISRRNKPCAHLVYGAPKAINSANLMYFLPLKKIMAFQIQEDKKRQLLQIYSKNMITCHLGQAEDVLTHKIQNSSQLPTLEQYIRMTSAKTSSLFSMQIEMLAVVLGISKENTRVLSDTMRLVGIAFQIIDDLLNITENLGKNRKAQDLHEKKFTIIVHHLRNNQKFMKLFFLQKKDNIVIDQMVQIIKQNGTIQYCQELAAGYAQKALKMIQKIQCPHSKKSFKALVRYVVERNK